MSNLVTLNSTLSREYQEDYWSDEVVVVVSDLLDQFTADEWMDLGNSWHQHPPNWQKRLGEALAGCLRTEAEGLLVAMIRAPQPEVANAAAESLIGVATWIPDAEDRAVLIALRHHLDLPEQRLIDQLLTRA